MRPIDADTLEEELVSHKYKYSPYLHFLDVAVTIERMPTIDAVPYWIPCEERLPEPKVAVLGYAPAFHNIFAVYYDSVCGWMTWCPACDEPFPSSQGEIVAWMPLPEPYREREGEQTERSRR